MLSACCCRACYLQHWSSEASSGSCTAGTSQVSYVTCREVGACACLSVLGAAASFKPGQGLRQPGLLPGLDQLLPLTVTLEHFQPPGSGAPGRSGPLAARTEEAKAAQDASRAAAAPAAPVSDSMLTEADFPALGPGSQRHRGSAAKLGGKRKVGGGPGSAGQPVDQEGSGRAKPQQQPGPSGQRSVGHWPGLSRDVMGWQVSFLKQSRGFWPSQAPGIGTTAAGPPVEAVPS